MTAPQEERRESPGRRVGDYEHSLEQGAITLVTRARRGYVVIAAAASAISSAGTVVLMLFGLRIGGAADLSDLRKATLRTDSVQEVRLTAHDSLIARNRKDLDRLSTRDEINRTLLCIIADKVGASTGGMCQGRQVTP